MTSIVWTLQIMFHILQDDSIIDYIFGGTACCATTCSFCHTCSYRYERFRSLEVSVPKNGSTLTDALKEHFADEQLFGDNQFDCSSCPKYKHCNLALAECRYVDCNFDHGLIVGRVDWHICTLMFAVFALFVTAYSCLPCSLHV